MMLDAGMWEIRTLMRDLRIVRTLLAWKSGHLNAGDAGDRLRAEGGDDLEGLVREQIAVLEEDDD